MSSYVIRVDGVPVPQGSKSAYVVGGRAVLADANKALKPWRRAVTEEAAKQKRTVLEGPVIVTLTFYLPRPKTVKRALPHVKPDLDKLIRAIFDSITDAGLWGDDSQVVDLHAHKAYSETPGVIITISELEEKAA